MPSVNVPGLGRVNFPQGTSQEDMERSIKDALGQTSTFDKMSTSQKAAARKQSMESGPAKAQYDQAIASADADINTRMKKNKDLMMTAGLVAAAPLTGGMSLAAGTAAMGAVGLGVGLNDLAIRKATGLGNVPQTAHDIALSLGISAGEGAAAELTGRAVGGMIQGAGSLIGDMATRAAATTSKGLDLVKRYMFKVRGDLTAAIPPEATASIGNAWRYTWSQLRKLPTKDVSRRTLQILDEFKTGGGKKLVLDAGGIADRQPLDLLIEKKGILQQQAYSKDVPWKEAEILKQMVSGLDNSIRTALSKVPGGSELYKQSNRLMEIVSKHSVATELGMQTVKQFLPKTAALATGANQLGQVALQRTMSLPASARIFSRAVDAFMSGARNQAATLAKKAFDAAGITELADEYVESQKQAQ